MNGETKKCTRCDGCGKVADSDSGEPWTAWASLPPGADLAVRMGIVRPVPCPACKGGVSSDEHGAPADMATNETTCPDCGAPRWSGCAYGRCEGCEIDAGCDREGDCQQIKTVDELERSAPELFEAVVATTLTEGNLRELCARSGCGHPRGHHASHGISGDDECSGWSEESECEAGLDGMEACPGFVAGSGRFRCRWDDPAVERYCIRVAGPGGWCDECRPTNETPDDERDRKAADYDRLAGEVEHLTRERDEARADNFLNKEAIDTLISERDEARALRAASDRVLASGVVVSDEKYANLVRLSGGDVSLLDELHNANTRAAAAESMLATEQAHHAEAANARDDWRLKAGAATARVEALASAVSAAVRSDVECVVCREPTAFCATDCLRRQIEDALADASPAVGAHQEIRIVFDGPPGHDAGRFVEVEDAEGRSIRAGRWEQKGDLWRLVIGGTATPPVDQEPSEPVCCPVDDPACEGGDDQSHDACEPVTAMTPEAAAAWGREVLARAVAAVETRARVKVLEAALRAVHADLESLDGQACTCGDGEAACAYCAPMISARETLEKAIDDDADLPDAPTQVECAALETAASALITAPPADLTHEWRKVSGLRQKRARGEHYSLMVRQAYTLAGEEEHGLRGDWFWSMDAFQKGFAPDEASAKAAAERAAPATHADLTQHPAYRAGIEAAAKVCDDWRTIYDAEQPALGSWAVGVGAELCAGAIRALLETKAVRDGE